MLRGAALNATPNRSARRDTVAGAVLGALGAVVGAYTFYHLRRELTWQGLPDMVVAVAEDALALAGGLRVLGD